MDALTPITGPSDASTNRYPNSPCNKSGHLAVLGNSQHRIYWEEYGSVNGEPVMFMHGGPGAGCHSSFTRFFNPARYRVVLFDQRGCGKSTPSAIQPIASDHFHGALLAKPRSAILVLFV